MTEQAAVSEQKWVTIACDEDTRDKLRNLAIANKRSMAAQIAYLVEQATISQPQAVADAN